LNIKFSFDSKIIREIETPSSHTHIH